MSAVEKLLKAIIPFPPPSAALDTLNLQIPDAWRGEDETQLPAGSVWHFRNPSLSRNARI
jgi:hypothetical protein